MGNSLRCCNKQITWIERFYCIPDNEQEYKFCKYGFCSNNNCSTPHLVIVTLKVGALAQRLEHKKGKDALNAYKELDKIRLASKHPKEGTKSNMGWANGIYEETRTEIREYRADFNGTKTLLKVTPRDEVEKECRDDCPKVW